MEATMMQTTTMRAAVVHRFGGPEVVQVERVPKPVPKADELLVRVHASTVSIADHRTRSREPEERRAEHKLSHRVPPPQKLHLLC